MDILMRKSTIRYRHSCTSLITNYSEFLRITRLTKKKFIFPKQVILFLIAFTGSAFAAETNPASPSPAELKKLSLEQLMNMEVTSVSKRPEKLLESPAAVYVISREDIRRAGVTSLPEALRLAPGVEVARSGTHSWSISIRGFNSDITNKLLVLIDGRSVYSPLYAGVFWDAQDTLLEDVDRIEVISGPGGTLWGANAVNGVINIITRSGQDTAGGYLEIGGGNEEQGFGGFRYGGRIGENAVGRVYVKYFNRDSFKDVMGGDAVEDTSMGQGGFHVDWEATQTDHVTIQGDLYKGMEEGLFRDDFTLGTLPGPDFKDDSEVSGGNLLGRWTRRLGEGSDLSLQAYYDHTQRNIPNTFNETRDTLDLDFQHHFRFAVRHNILWGTGFRLTTDNLDISTFASFDPDSRTDQTFSAFVQDEIDLFDARVFLTLGSKFERNDYSGFEVQPNIRLTWLITEQQTFWAAVSRAVRIPSRLDADLRLTAPIAVPGLPFPLYVRVNGNHDFEPEKLLAYEAGYRIEIMEGLSFDLTAFYNDYNDLQTTEPGTPVVVPVPTPPPPIYVILPNSLANGMEGESYGTTLVARWQPATNWRLQFAYAYFDLQLHNKTGSLDPSSNKAEGNSPENQFSIHSFLDLPHDLGLYTGIRFVDNLPNQDIESYTALDISLSWTPQNDLELSVTGQNLSDDGHAEFGDGNEIERSIYGMFKWRF